MARPPRNTDIPITYDKYGTRRQHIYWLVAVLLVLTLNVVVFHAVRTNENMVRVLSEGVWVVGVALGTFRILVRLERLEHERGEPDETMKLLFQVTTMFPILGYAPIILFRW